MLSTTAPDRQAREIGRQLDNNRRGIPASRQHNSQLFAVQSIWREFDPALDVNVCNDWAMMASTPNWFAVLSTDDDERNDNDVLNEQAFTTVVHRRNKRNRTSPEAATSA